MAEINIEKMGKRVAEEALDGYIYKGKTLREWIDILAQTQWIPVSERLPETLDWYLTSIKWDDGTERVTISWFDGVSFKAEVKAWMPLPAPEPQASEVSE